MSAHPKNLTFGVIGTQGGVDGFIQWCRVARGALYPGEKKNPNLWPVFPGFETAFCTDIPRDPAWVHELDTEELKRVSSDRDANKRAASTVELYLDAIEKTTKKDEVFSAIICVVPDFVWQNCRPESFVPGSSATGTAISKKEKTLRAGGQTGLFEAYNPETYQYSVDFRRQLKARAMKFSIPIQIIRESRLAVDPAKVSPMQSPPSDFAWNLLTTLYYKGGGKPWRLAAARPGVCYIGIVFRRTDSSAGNQTACCAAQMFLDSGDGVVFLGEFGPWYSPTTDQFHLSEDAARDLLKGVLKTYAELEGQPLTEIFLHCRSTISDQEFAAYKSACPEGVELVGVRVRKNPAGIRLFREGTRPVIRGTFLVESPTMGHLWASGFIPRLKTYPGWEVPVPLSISIQHGEADIQQVAKDILSLTKLNYNACKFGDSEPVTIGFSNAVGEILVSNPTIRDRSPKFKHYI